MVLTILGWLFGEEIRLNFLLASLTFMKFRKYSKEVTTMEDTYVYSHAVRQRGTHYEVENSCKGKEPNYTAGEKAWYSIIQYH